MGPLGPVCPRFRQLYGLYSVVADVIDFCCSLEATQVMGKSLRHTMYTYEVYSSKIITFWTIKIGKILTYTAIPYRVSTGPEQGFPCVLFPNREKPVFITGIPANGNRFFPVRKSTQENPMSM